MLMFHSFQQYACYWALFCLIQQQQYHLSSAVTIIIDGATTNEWATRDEYQRLVGSTSAAEIANGQRRLLDSSRSGDDTTGVAATSDANVGNGDNGAADFINDGRQLIVELPASASSPSSSSSSSSSSAASSASMSAPSSQRDALMRAGDVSSASELASEQRSVADTLSAALDKLDLIEAQQRRLMALEGANLEQQLRQQHQQPRIQSDGRLALVAGSRSLNDLVPLGDADLEDPTRRKERGSATTPQKYCGAALMDMLELVCNGRFYNGEFEPTIVNPTVKTKRYLAVDELARQHQSGTRRRQLPLTEGDGGDGGSHGGSFNNYYLSSPSPPSLAPSPASASSSSSSSASSPLASSLPTSSSLPLARSADDLPDSQSATNGREDENDSEKAKIISLRSSSGGAGHANINNVALNRQKPRNRHSRMLLYRGIRGANTECCQRPCNLDQLKSYCQSMTHT